MAQVIQERWAQATVDFESFYRAQYPQIYRAAFLATSDSDLALDATQEAFKKAYARWRRLQRHEWAGGWVMTTTLNLCKRMGSRAARERASDVSAETHIGGPRPDRVDVSKALATLPARQRMATILFYIGDLPLDAIAYLMGVSEGTVKAHLAQARASLRDALEVRDV
ncbi:MAG: sigma-70 family RNA polymerase sigma factor [Actinomycetota bacterium]